MKCVAELITAVAALVAALAWPSALLAALLTFKKEIRQAIAKVPGLFDRMKSVKIFEIEAELEKVADEAIKGDAGKGGSISPSELMAAGRIKGESHEIGQQALLSQMDRLCVEYDTIRRIMPPSASRTRAMTQVLVRMRMLGPSVSDSLDAYTSSSSAGSRLAAVAMMQIQPEKADLDWLLRRFSEDAPFIFYHASLALQSVVNNIPSRLPDVKNTASKALQIVRSFDGEPDPETIFVLQALLEERDSGKYV